MAPDGNGPATTERHGTQPGHKRKVLVVVGTRPGAIKMAPGGPRPRAAARVRGAPLRHRPASRAARPGDDDLPAEARLRPRHHGPRAVADRDRALGDEGHRRGDPAGAPGVGSGPGRHHDLDVRQPGRIPRGSPPRSRRGRAADAADPLAVPGGGKPAHSRGGLRNPLRSDRVGGGEPPPRGDLRGRGRGHRQHGDRRPPPDGEDPLRSSRRRTGAPRTQRRATGPCHAHRRENLGAPMEQICEGLREAAERHPEPISPALSISTQRLAPPSSGPFPACPTSACCRRWITHLSSGSSTRATSS